MKYKTNLLFNFFNPDFYNYFIFAVIGVFIVGLVRFFENKSAIVILEVILSSAVLAVILFIYSIFEFPQYIMLYPEEIIYTKRIFKPNSHGKGGRRIKVTLSVRNIRKFEYYQNSIEKKYNVGRIKFYGHTDLSRADIIDSSTSNTHTIYGLVDLDAFIKACGESGIKCTEAKFK